MSDHGMAPAGGFKGALRRHSDALELGVIAPGIRTRRPSSSEPSYLLCTAIAAHV